MTKDEIRKMVRQECLDVLQSSGLTDDDFLVKGDERLTVKETSGNGITYLGFLKRIGDYIIFLGKAGIKTVKILVFSLGLYTIYSILHTVLVTGYSSLITVFFTTYYILDTTYCITVFSLATRHCFRFLAENGKLQIENHLACNSCLLPYFCTLYDICCTIFGGDERV